MKLTQSDKDIIHAAVQDTERRTSAKISVVVLPASDPYQEFILLYGFVAGSIVSLALWSTGILAAFPWLLLIQLGIIVGVDFVPWLRQCCARLVPQRVRHYRAGQAAHHEYHAVHANLPKDEPFVLLFVALAERYVQVMTNPIIHKRISGGWDIVAKRFTDLIGKKQLKTACGEAIARIAEILEPHFPPRKGP